MEETEEQVKAIVAQGRIPTTIEMGGRGIILRSFEDLQRFSKMAVESGAAPKGMNQAGAALAIQAGLERGLGPLGGLQACIVINGVLSWRGWAAMALIRNSGHCKPGSLRVWTEGEGDALVGKATAWRVGYEAPELVTWNVKDAKTARLWGKEGPWSSRPGNMLMWRAMGDLARFHWSDVLGGFPLQEEAEDYEELPRSTGPRPEPMALTPKADDPLLSGIVTPAEPEAPQPDPEPAPEDCRHPKMPPSRLATVPSNESMACPDCGELLWGEAAS